MDLAIVITCDLLGLPDLDINDHVNFEVVDLGDQGTTWNKITAKSPWVDGEIIVQRSKNNISRQLTVEVLGADWLGAKSNARDLAAAVSQDTFSLVVVQDSSTTTLLCEASDYTWNSSKERWHAQRGLMTINLTHLPLVGGAV